VEVSFSVGRDVIGWRKLKPTSETLHNNFSARQYSQPNNILLGGDHKALNTRNTENDSEMKREAEERKLHRMAKVHAFLDMWQGRQNLHTTQKESHLHNKQMTAVECISAVECIIEASWSLLQHNSGAAFNCPAHRICPQLGLRMT
jgi:hypothetical protein